MTNNFDNILVKIRITDNFAAVTTYCRQHGHRGEFLLSLEQLRKWLLEDDGHWNLMKQDSGNIISLHLASDTVHIQTWWLSTYGLDIVKGFTLRFTIPENMLRSLLCDGEPIKYLYKPKPQTSCIESTHASKTILRICTNKLTRRALSKAMRDCFQWRGNIVTLYPDGYRSFFFRTSSGCPDCGGLILHETTVKTPAGEKQKLSYSVHT